MARTSAPDSAEMYKFLCVSAASAPPSLNSHFRHHQKLAENQNQRDYPWGLRRLGVQAQRAHKRLDKMNRQRGEHNNMSRSDHEWIQVLMRRRMEQRANAREGQAPPPPGIYNRDRRSSSCRWNSVSESELRTPESRTHKRIEAMLHRPSLNRRITDTTCDSHFSVEDLDTPFEVSVRPAYNEREDIEDNLSELSYDEEEFYSWTSSFHGDEQEEEPSTSTSTEPLTAPMGFVSSVIPALGVENGWGITTLCLDEALNEDGTPKKNAQWRALDGTPVRNVCALEQGPCIQLIPQAPRKEKKITED